jgi:hypothetical protein
MTTPARSFPLGPALDGHTGGELVQSLIYREAYTPAPTYQASVYDAPTRHRHAPRPFAVTADAAWALVSVAAAGCVLVVLVLVLIRVVGWLT